MCNLPPILVSIIVPCRNERASIGDFLADVSAQTGLDGEYEVLIADGMSDDGTGAILQQAAQNDARIRILDNPSMCVSHGLNIAARAAQGVYLARMDVHTRYAPDYLQQCLLVARRTQATNVGGPALTMATGWTQTANAVAYGSWFSVGGARFHDPCFEGDVDTVPYGFWRRDVFFDAGLFDEELVRNQDDELNLRMRRAGGRIHQSPAIRSWYAPREELSQIFSQYYQYGYWKVRVIQKHSAVASWRHLVPVMAMCSGVLLASMAPFSWQAIFAFGASVATYVAASLIASLIACRRTRQWRVLPILPLIFSLYHAGYALGFTAGVVDFVVLKRGGRTSTARLTR